MKIAAVYGRFCSGGPGVFDVANLYTSTGKGLTGSESFFWNTVRGLAERGHEVQAFADVADEMEHVPTLAGAAAFKLESGGRLRQDVDAVLGWNEPDLLRLMPPTALRVCVQQLNDFDYCSPDFDQFVDLYAFPSETHRTFMLSHGRRDGMKLDRAKTVVMPNCLNLEMYDGLESRRPHSVAYCSSPD